MVPFQAEIQTHAIHIPSKPSKFQVFSPRLYIYSPKSSGKLHVRATTHRFLMAESNVHPLKSLQLSS